MNSFSSSPTSPAVGGSRSSSLLTKGSDQSKANSWYEAMAKAWGQVLDTQAGQIEGLSDRIAGGDEQPSTLTQLSAASAQMQFLATSSSSSLGSMGTALETMARKG
jgi:hypothetical protein